MKVGWMKGVKLCKPYYAGAWYFLTFRKRSFGTPSGNVLLITRLIRQNPHYFLCNSHVLIKSFDIIGQHGNFKKNLNKTLWWLLWGHVLFSEFCRIQSSLQDTFRSNTIQIFVTFTNFLGIVTKFYFWYQASLS